MTLLNKRRLDDRVEGRDQAKAIIGLDLLTLDNQDKLDAFVDHLNDTFRPKPIVDVQSKAKQDRIMVQRLAAVTLKFGQHEGEQLDEIPRDYLSWLLESSEQLCNDIREYLEATEDNLSVGD